MFFIEHLSREMQADSLSSEPPGKPWELYEYYTELMIKMYI